jgi:hypothetical protein
MYSYELEEDVEGGYCTMSDGFILPVFCIREVLPGVKRVRKELGWGKSETVGKKRKRGDEDEDAVPSYVRRPGTAE